MDPQYYILLADRPFEKTEGFVGRAKEAFYGPAHALKGELPVKDEYSDNLYHLHNDSSKSLVLQQNEVALLTEDEYEWLVPMEKQSDRIYFYHQQDKLHILPTLQVEDKVWISLPESKTIIPGQSYLKLATVQYIGPLEGKPGRYLGLELLEKCGTSDGCFRDVRYFTCPDDYGIFLPGDYFTAKSSLRRSSQSSHQTTEPMNYSAAVKGKVLVPADRSATGREFREGDKVVMYSDKEKEIPGIVKWALPGKSYKVEGFILGIETDHNTSKKVPGHVTHLLHFFKAKDKKHTYFAVPEKGVHKVGPEESDLTRSFVVVESHFEEESKLSQSVIQSASKLAKKEGVSTQAILNTQFEAEREITEKKTKEIINPFGITAQEFEEQKKQLNYIKMAKRKKDEEKILAADTFSQRSPSNPDIQRRSSHNDHGPSNQPRGGNLARQHSHESREKPQPRGHPLENKPKYQSPQKVSHRWEIGSAVQVQVEKESHFGTVKWIGTFPGVRQEVAGVELEDKIADGGDGSWNGVDYFYCPKGHAMFVAVDKLRPTVDRLVPDSKLMHSRNVESRSGEQRSNHFQEIADLRSEFMEIRNTCLVLKEENAQVMSKLDMLLLENEELKQADSQAKEDICNLQISLAQVKGDNVNLKSSLSEVKGECERLSLAYTQSKEENQRIASTLGDMQRANQRLSEAKDELERQLMDQLSEIKERLEQMQPSWFINPVTLEITDEELGRGAWGEVKVGMYCGGHVAVKRVHQVIISDYNRDQFKREMQIVSRLRHPHLVQFIGAVTTGTLTIVTELMETSLRKQLELGRISEEHILPISRDVACALNYLHSLPEPIIHRDVSSANVLLNSKPGGGWMAKLGDFGSANFLAQLRT